MYKLSSVIKLPEILIQLLNDGFKDVLNSYFLEQKESFTLIRTGVTLNNLKVLKYGLDHVLRMLSRCQQYQLERIIFVLLETPGV